MSTGKIQIFSDGGARGNPGPAAIGVVICDPKGDVIYEHREIIGETTNNVAEYTAVIVGLELAKAQEAKTIDYFVDSELVANQLSGTYKIKAPHIQVLAEKAKKSIALFEKVSFKQVPRTHEKIKHADRLVNQALDEGGY